ncbi:MAG: hypothetical protein R3E88_04735 [Myxococcota bacterium]
MEPEGAASWLPEACAACAACARPPGRARARVRRLAAAVLAALASATAGALPGARAAFAESAASAPADETWYAQEVARGDHAFLVTHYWSKGDKLRAETVLAGRRIVTIVNGATYYTLDPTRGVGLAIERSALARAGDARRDRPFADDFHALVRAGGELVGTEALGGQPVERYRLTNESGRVEVWVTPDRKLPVRVARFRHATASTDQKDYVNWLRGVPIDDRFFEPPSGIDVERIGYEDYVRTSATKPLGPAPPFYGYLLHGEPEGDAGGSD